MKKIKTERTHLFAPNIGVAIKIEILGEPSDEQIESAIHLAVLNNETLHSKVVLRENGLAFYEKSRPNYQVQKTDKKWTEIVAKFPKHPLDIFNGEMAVFYIIREKGHLELLVIGHHLTGDGLSFIYLMEDFMRALNGENLTYKPLLTVKVHDFPKGSEMPTLKKLYLKILNGKWRKNPTIFNRSDYSQLVENYGKDYAGCVLEHQLNDVETTRLIQYAKAAGVSVNSLLVTAFLKEYGKTATTGVPVSIRTPDYKGMGNLVSGLTITYCYNAQIDFLSNVRAVQDLIYTFMKNDKKKYFVLRFIDMMEGPFLDSAAMVKYLGYSNPLSKKLAIMMNYGDNLSDMGITNPGQIRIPTHYGKYSIKNMGFAAPVTPYNKRIMGIVTFDNTMCITMNTIVCDKEKEKVFFTRVVEFLRTL